MNAETEKRLAEIEQNARIVKTRCYTNEDIIAIDHDIPYLLSLVKELQAENGGLKHDILIRDRTLDDCGNRLMALRKAAEGAREALQELVSLAELSDDAIDPNTDLYVVIKQSEDAVSALTAALGDGNAKEESNG